MVTGLNKKVLSVLLVAFIAVSIWTLVPQGRTARAADCKWCQWGDWYYWYTVGNECRGWNLSCFLSNPDNPYSLDRHERWRQDCKQYGTTCYYRVESRYPQVGCCWKP